MGIVQWQNARLWLWMSWVRPPLPTPTFSFEISELAKIVPSNTVQLRKYVAKQPDFSAQNHAHDFAVGFPHRGR